MARIAAMMPDNHHLDSPKGLLVEKMIRKIREIRPPDEFTERWKVPWICKSLGHSVQQVVEEPIRELRPGFVLVVIENLPDIADGKPVISHLHAGRPNALRNSS